MTEIGYDAMWSHKERKKIATLDRRARFLEARNGGDHDEGEAAAIRWALKTLDAARATSPTLDVAWREAEAAIVAAGLDDRFVSVELAVFRALGDAGEPVRYVATAERIEHRQPSDPPAVTHDEETEADTPAAALQALAARLRGPA